MGLASSLRSTPKVKQFTLGARVPGIATGNPVQALSESQPRKKSYPIMDRTLFVEGPMGLEPMTPCLKGRCSNRLSYGPKL